MEKQELVFQDRIKEVYSQGVYNSAITKEGKNHSVNLNYVLPRIIIDDKKNIRNK